MIKRILTMCLLITTVCRVKAQHPTININSGNIGSEVSTEILTFSATCLLSVVPSIKVRASGNWSDNGSPAKTVSVNKSMLKVTYLGSTAIANVNILGSTYPEQTLGLSDATLYSALAVVNVVGGDNVTIKYRIPQAEMTNFAWHAGTYTTNLVFTTPGGLACLFTETFNRTFTLNVAPFITATTPANATITVNNLEQFRTGSVTGTNSATFLSTIKLNTKIKTAATTMSYTPTTANMGSTVNAAVNKINATITNAPAGYALNPGLSTTYQSMLNTALDIPVGNSQSSTYQYSISAANLKSGFYHAGTYTATLNYEVFDANGAATSQFTNATLQVNVSEMGEMVMNNSTVDLSFNNASDYANGVETNMPQHLTFSKTIPYDVYVKASANTLGNGNGQSIPVGIIKIGAGDGQTGISNISLSTTAQRIIDAAAPEIDRNVDIKYTIDAGDVPQLLGKPEGTYSVDVVYSFVAL